MPRKRHQPAQAEVDYWLSVTQDVQKLHSLKYRAEPPPATQPSVRLQNSGAILTLKHDCCAHENLSVNYHPGIDHNQVKRMKQGKLQIQATLDLHGYTMEQAFIALESFIIYSAQQSLRTLLIITGKGSREQKMTIKSALLTWVHTQSIRPYILSISVAHNKHGGHGAFYVLLRKFERVSG